MKELFWFASAYILTLAIMPLSLEIMRTKELVGENYKKTPIPTPAGLIPVMAFIVILACYTLLLNELHGWPLIGMFLLLTILGVLDDRKGSSQYKGFRGHFRALKSGYLTTGMCKLIGVGLLALYGAKIFGPSQFLILNGLVIALTTNFINLMDLRPGRAGKIFLILIVMVLIFKEREQLFWVWIFLGAFMAYLPWDLRSLGMLGDTGANVMGFVLGLAFIVVFKEIGVFLILLILILVHIYAEKASISQLIDRAPLLSFLDRLGRPDY